MSETNDLRELQEKLAMAEAAIDEALSNIQAGCLFYPPPQSLPRATIIEIGLRLKKALEDIRQ